ncbi:hypothetical protein EGR_10962 [Echinococcus granulosus]|uniref:Uncharacterized protein n=1 Tax=Echinococcus granulosus TaxID=6210 RepID=W6TZE6_ECHGR|nr:hypothetical protein EGR_10962 [Echinococcus granulosus]EUB54180.1 hypothetical protein EGR_10962 [Echinococcus granulosus]
MVANKLLLLKGKLEQAKQEQINYYYRYLNDNFVTLIWSATTTSYPTPYLRRCSHDKNYKQLYKFVLFHTTCSDDRLKICISTPYFNCWQLISSTRDGASLPVHYFSFNHQLLQPIQLPNELLIYSCIYSSLSQVAYLYFLPFRHYIIDLYKWTKRLNTPSSFDSILPSMLGIVTHFNLLSAKTFKSYLTAQRQGISYLFFISLPLTSSPYYAAEAAILAACCCKPKVSIYLPTDSPSEAAADSLLNLANKSCIT